ncbi:hypothetical protein HN51_021528, partial [Arachis hypogaea]
MRSNPNLAIASPKVFMCCRCRGFCTVAMLSRRSIKRASPLSNFIYNPIRSVNEKLNLTQRDRIPTPRCSRLQVEEAIDVIELENDDTELSHELLDHTEIQLEKILYVGLRFDSLQLAQEILQRLSRPHSRSFK